MPKTGGHHEGYALKTYGDATFKAGKTKRTTGCPDWSECDTCPFPKCRLGVPASVFATYVEEYRNRQLTACKV